MRCCATCRGRRLPRWRRSRFPANGAAPRGGRRLSIMGLAGRDGFAGDAANPSVEAWPRLARVRCPARTARPGLGVLPNPPEACLGPMPRPPPQTHPARPRTVSVRVHHGKENEDQKRIAALARSRAWLGSTERQCAENCRRRGGSDSGGVSRMDAATKPPWTDSRRPPPSDPPRQPAAILPLLLLLLSTLQVQGCKPCQNTYVTQPAITSNARIASHSSSIRHTRLIASRRSGSRCHTGNSPASV